MVTAVCILITALLMLGLAALIALCIGAILDVLLEDHHE